MENIESAIEEYENILEGCIARNLPLIIALQLDIEDVRQELTIRMWRALGKFDEERSPSLPSFLRHELQYELLDIRRRHMPHGMKSVPRNERINVVYLDERFSDNTFPEIPVDDCYDLALHDIMKLFTEEELAVIKRKYVGESIRSKPEKSILARARAVLSEYFPERMPEYA